MCRVDEKHVFIGSRLADSVLLKYEALDDGTSHVESNASELNQERVDDSEDFEMLFYGQKLKIESERESVENQVSLRKRKFLFEQVDKLLNTGPQIGSIIAPSILDEHGDRNLNLSSHDSFVDFVTCSGFRDSSSVSVLENGVRSYLLNSVDFQSPVL
jgi:hypothetical protein